jgi:protein-S-isoprenylcysteine O-methyltransferase Ste14
VKASIGALAAITLLSLAVWAFFYVLTPATPLTPPETLVVVGVCAGIVFGGKRLWTRRRRTGGGNGA